MINLLLYVLFTFSSLQSQNPDKDSLIIDFDNAGSRLQKIAAGLKIVERNGSDTNQILPYYRTALAYSLELEEVEWEWKLRRAVVGLYRSKSLSDLKLAELKSLLTLARSEFGKNREGEINLELGFHYENIGSFDIAIDHYSKALELFDSDNFTGLLTGYSNLARSYFNLGNYAKSSSYYEESLKYLSDSSSARSRIIVLFNIGLTNHELDRYDNALKWYSEAMHFAKSESLWNMEKIILANIAIVYEESKNYQMALDIYRQYEEESKANGEPVIGSRIINNMAVLYRRMGELDLAEALFLKAIAIKLSDNDSLGLAYSYSALGETYRLMK